MKIFILILLLGSSVYAEDVLKLRAGFVKKLTCEGKLYASSIGNDNLVRLEALPKELGCAVILKPIASSGRTNLILETSTGTMERLIEIAP